MRLNLRRIERSVGSFDADCGTWVGAESPPAPHRGYLGCSAYIPPEIPNVVIHNVGNAENVGIKPFQMGERRNAFSDVMRYVGSIGITPFQIGKTGKWAKSVTLERNVTLICAYVDMTKI